MTDESVIWDLAKVLIEAHGENASFEAAQRADWAIEDGNPQAERTWMRVLKAIEEWQQSNGTGEHALH